VYLLGFLLPGEAGGHHSRTEATDVTAEVKECFSKTCPPHVRKPAP
jgi:hypothetical protein